MRCTTCCGGEAVAPFLDHDAASPRTAVSVRLLRTRDPRAIGATQSLGAPPQGRRVLVVLQGALRAGWQARQGTGDVAAVPLLRGHAVSFDPARWTLRPDAIDGECEVLEIALMPMPAGAERWTVAADFCDWPIDPLAIALGKVAMCPSVPGSHLHAFRETASTL